MRIELTVTVTEDSGTKRQFNLWCEPIDSKGLLNPGFDGMAAELRRNMGHQYFMLPVVKRMKEEILADVAGGKVPVSVGSFGELHDHMDANEYGGFCDGANASLEFMNAAQSEIDAWIKAGGLNKKA